MQLAVLSEQYLLLLHLPRIFFDRSLQQRTYAQKELLFLLSHQALYLGPRRGKRNRMSACQTKLRVRFNNNSLGNRAMETSRHQVFKSVGKGDKAKSSFGLIRCNPFN